VLTVHGAREHNLKDIDVSFPLGCFVAVTGVSGSGKSTLVNDILYTHLARELNGARAVPGRHTRVSGVEHLDKVVHVDQSPIGRTPRSNPATYTGVFDHIRRLFAETTEAKVRGYLPGRFSFNVKGGRCENCQGDGTIKIEMNFLPDVYVPCEVCHGKRYNEQTLQVHYKGKTISEVLEMPVAEALEFFEAIPGIARHLKTLNDVGLGYVRLGQSATTLSGGEAQRVKLASELQRRSTGRTVYVLDEPTTGLHFEDIRKLLGVLGRLVDTGNSVIVIEHNLDVIKTADWIVDMGPEGGSGGGTVVAEGTPEQVAKVKESHTGRFLKEILS
jgi:excinuclease ABC subunit A